MNTILCHAELHNERICLLYHVPLGPVLCTLIQGPGPGPCGPGHDLVLTLGLAGPALGSGK